MKTLFLLLVIFLGLTIPRNCSATVAASSYQSVILAPITADNSGESVADIPVETPTKKGFFGRIWDGLTKGNGTLGVILGIIGGFLANKGWITKIKSALGYGVVVSDSLIDLLSAGRNGLQALNDAIQENGKLKENSIDDIKTSGKTVYAKFDDFKVKITPNKK